MFIIARRHKEQTPAFDDRYTYTIINNHPTAISGPPWLTHSDFPNENQEENQDSKALVPREKSAVPEQNGSTVGGGAAGEGQEDTASHSSAGSRSHTSGSVLLEAAERGDLSTVKNVLGRQTAPDPDHKTKYQSRSALQLACGYGQLEVVEQLLQVDIDILYAIFWLQYIFNIISHANSGWCM